MENKGVSNIQVEIMEERNNFLQKAKKIREKIHSSKEKKGDNDDKLTLVIGVICIGIACFFGWKVYSDSQEMNTEITSLKSKEKYNIQELRTNPITKNMITDISSIGQFKDIEMDINQNLERYTEHKDNLELSYTYFLQYLLLPRLNIRKELFTNTIKTNLLGGAFLENNPYNDIKIFEKWTNFLSDANNNEINSISKLHIGDIKEENGFFTIDIDFAFDSPSRSAFLILLEKLTMTSDKENLNNLGEFFYYLRQEIKRNSQDAISDEKKGLPENMRERSENEIIGYRLYERAMKDKSTSLINEGIINRSIINMFECKKENLPQCYYKFREKYRNIGSLAYTVGDQENKNKTEDLRTFIKELPPIMSVQDFSFSKQESKNILGTNTEKYLGTAKIRIYGKDIKDDEMDEITKKLGKQCFGEDKNISLDDAMNIINQSISQKTDIGYIKSEEEDNTQELKTILEKIQADFSSLGNYKKTIRLFEIYRMLNENGLCKTM